MLLKVALCLVSIVYLVAAFAESSHEAALAQDHLIAITQSPNDQFAKSVDIEGSGEDEPAEAFVTEESSIKGIPKIYPKLPPPPVLSPQREFRRKQATVAEYSHQYGHPRQPTFVGSVLDYLGFKPPQIDGPKTDQEETLTDLFYEKSVQNAPKPLNHKSLQTISLHPTKTQCPAGRLASTYFNIMGFMGQWYQVMYSTTNYRVHACRMFSFRMLNVIPLDHNVGSTFETLEFSTDGTPYSAPSMSSGFGLLNMPGELHFRNPKENINANIIHAGAPNSSGFYQYAILAVDCNYPIYVLARDPFIFHQKYEAEALYILKQKGLVNDISRVLNLVKTVDFSSCVLPPNFFASSA